MRLILGSVAVVAMSAGLATSANAAFLSGSYDTAPASPAVLTGPNTFNWGIWDHTSSTQTGAPTNVMLGGDGSIGNAFAVLNGSPSGTVRGVGGALSVTYSDGTSPTSQTNAAIGALSNATFDTIGAGYRLEITGDPNAVRTVQVYVGGFSATGSFTASLNGATTYVADDVIYSAATNPKDRDLYVLNFQPDSAADKLVITHWLSADGANASSHVLLSAVAVTPEPGALALAGIAALGLLARRRRRCLTRLGR